MKMNLPSTWNSQKMSTLFLLIFLKSNGVKGGQAFNNCLTYYCNGDSTFYNKLLTYPFIDDANISSGVIADICCDEIKCSSPWSSCFGNNVFYFGCNKIAQNIFCDAGALCGGIVGDAPITEKIAITSSNSTSELASIIDYMKTISAYYSVDGGNFKWVCLDNTPCNGSICYWDNGGWTCYSYTKTNHYLQWPALSPNAALSDKFASVSNFPVSTISSSFSTFSSQTSSASLPANSISNPNLLPIIASLGTVTGVGSMGGLTYYIIRKRRKNKQLGKEELELEQINEDLTARAETKNKNELLSNPNEQEEAISHKPDEIMEELRVSDAEREDNYHQLLNNIKTKLGSDSELLDNFLDAQELFQNNPTVASAQRNYQRAKNSLGSRISWLEMGSLETVYQQKPDEQYQAYMEAGPSHRTGDVHLTR